MGTGNKCPFSSFLVPHLPQVGCSHLLQCWELFSLRQSSSGGLSLSIKSFRFSPQSERSPPIFQPQATALEGKRKMPAFKEEQDWVEWGWGTLSRVPERYRIYSELVVTIIAVTIVGFSSFRTTPGVSHSKYTCASRVTAVSMCYILSKGFTCDTSIFPHSHTMKHGL